MKKSILTVLLAAAFVTPVFATTELDLKVGYIVEPTVVQTSASEYKVSYSQESSYLVGIDFYYYLVNNLAIGLGANYIFNSEFDGHFQEDAKLGSANGFVAIKPILAEKGLVDKVYLLGQLGMGATNYDDDKNNFSETGLYWGAGFGLEKWNIIVEVLYSVNYWKHEDEGTEVSFSNRRLSINAGLKFNL